MKTSSPEEICYVNRTINKTSPETGNVIKIMTKYERSVTKRMSTSETVCSFSCKMASQGGRRKSAKKALFKRGRLCYSIEEAERWSLYRLTRVTSTGANGQKQSRKQSFKFRWRNIPQEEIAANMYGSGEVDRIGILCAALLSDYVRGNQFREVVHGQLSKDFLVDVLHLFCVEMDKAEGIF